jgi:predicted ArsR family transcriptional regulator
MQANTKQIADRLGVSYVVAAGLIKYLTVTGRAKLVEKVRHPSGKGKPTSVYEVSDSVVLDLSAPASDVSEAA